MANLYSKRWWIFAAMCGAYSMIYLDQGLTSVAMPTIQQALNLSEEVSRWVMNAYFLSLAVFVVTGGRLADVIGLRKMYLLGVSVFLVMTAACSLVSSGQLLVVCRFFQGLGAAMMLPVGQAVIYHVFEKRELGKVMGFYGAIAVTFLTLAPYLGGLLVETGHWRYVFMINIPLCLITLGLTLWSTPKALRPPVKERFDLKGQCLLAIVLIALIVGLLEGNRWGWMSLNTLLCWTVSAMAAFNFYWVEREEMRRPLIDFSLFSLKPFLGAMIVLFVIQFLFMVSIILVEYFQRGLAFSPSNAGLLMLFITIPQIILNPIVGKYADRVGCQKLIYRGLSVIAVGLVWLMVCASTQNLMVLMPGLLAYSIGAPMVFTPLFRVMMLAVKPAQQGAASGIGFASRQLGGALGLASMGMILIRYNQSEQLLHSSTGQFIDGFSVAMGLSACVALVGIFATMRFIEKEEVKA